MDSVWEQRELEARKMLGNAAESPGLDACFVRRFLLCHTMIINRSPLSYKEPFIRRVIFINPPIELNWIYL